MLSSVYAQRLGELSVKTKATSKDKMAKQQESEARSGARKRQTEERSDERSEELESESFARNGYRPLYTPVDTERIAPSQPGSPPYTRGAYPTMYLHRPWTIRQYAGFSSAAESNRFYRHALQAGQRGLSVAFDLPTHRGYDSDHPRATGDVGKAGTAIDSVEDMKALFHKIPLDQVSVSMTMNGAVIPVLACFLVASEEQQVQWSSLTGTIQNDILKEYLVRNTYIYPPEQGMRVAIDVIEFISTSVPKFNSISVSGYHFQEAGADPALELAFTLADAIAYLDAVQARGIDIDAIAPRISFFFGIGMNFLLEIAKLRAARTLWYELMQKYKPQNPRSSVLRTHCQTSGYSLTQQQPLNNIVRTTIEAMAAVLGGTQSLHTNAYDEAVSIPTDQAAQVARNTQLILQHETDIAQTIDPLGGSYAIESLTRELQTTAREIIAEITRQGGMIRAIEQGYARQRIEEAAARKQALIDRGEEIVIGVNKFRDAGDNTPLDFRDIDTTALRARQLRSLQKIKKERDNSAVKKSLQWLRESAETTTNLLPPAIDAIRQRATIGEVSVALEDVFGRYQPAGVLTVTTAYIDTHGEDEQVAAVQAQVARFATQTGRQPRILVAKLGQDGHDRGLQVIAAGFSNFGFDVDLSPLFQTPAEVVKHALENDVHVIGISTHTASHKVLIPKLLADLKTAKAMDIAVVAGGIIPLQDYEFLRAAGVADIFDPGTPIPICAARVMDILLTDVS